MMGIPLDGPAWMFGDNQSVLTSSTLPHSSLNKRHNALAYHRVREAVAAKVMYFQHVSGKINVSDIFTKFLPWTTFWPLVQPLLFWKGETMQSMDITPVIFDSTLPLQDLITIIKESTAGLRGVTSDTDDRTMNPTADCSGVRLGVLDTIHETECIQMDNSPNPDGFKETPTDNVRLTDVNKIVTNALAMIARQVSNELD
jgi:hypothetical protein